MPFHNRIDELAALEDRAQSAIAEFMVIYGRRRIGKTELILQFTKRRRHIYLEATSGTENDHLADISALIADLTGRELLRRQPLPDWSAVFEALAEALADGPLVITLDEFQFIARQTPQIGSLINRFWRTNKENPGLFLILSGSDIGFFNREVIGHAATTYGRRTGGLRLQPFAPRELQHFLPRWKTVDLVRAYAVFGGIPYYLEQLRPADSLEQNILRVVLAPDAPLREEPVFLFAQHTELRQDAIYFSALRAIAAGQTRRNQIAQRIGRAADQTGEILARLVEMDLVRRVHPVTAANPDRTRAIGYEISDHFTRFWFRFVHPFSGRIHDAGAARSHLRRQIMPILDDFVAKPAFEDICRAWLLRETGAAAVGGWWGSVKEREAGGPPVNVSREIDAVAVDESNRITALGTCKWQRAQMPVSELELLNRLARHAGSGPSHEDLPLYFFSRSGFSKKLVEAAVGNPNLHLVAAAEVV